jgi:hypothetical protein
VKVTGLWGQKWPVMHNNSSAHDQFRRQCKFSWYGLVGEKRGVPAASISLTSCL